MFELAHLRIFICISTPTLLKLCSIIKNLNINSFLLSNTLIFLDIFKALVPKVTSELKQKQFLVSLVFVYFLLLSSLKVRDLYLDPLCSTTGKPTRSFATERVSLDSV